MADININKFRTSVVREGSRPASPGFVESEGQDPVDPAGSTQNHLPVTIAPAATALSITDSQVLGGAGTVAQYVRGDGSLADFPESSGGGSSVSYYLNGSVSQGTIGGVAYLEMNKVPILGAGTDFTRNSNGYIASFITDAGDPNLLEIPAGNWNFESYFSASSGGGSPTFYVELYKVNAGGTATLIASNSANPELISFGTTIAPYFSSLAVPTTVLALTDRLAVRYYVTPTARTLTLHTEGPHLCQIITTFTTGLTALNGLTSQVQFFAVGTSGTDFNIASATATHTFNLPTASATNRGALSSTDWSVFNSKIGGSGTSGQIAYFNGTSSITGESSLIWDETNNILQVTGSIFPATDNTGVIGNSSFTWSNGQFTNLTIDGTLNVRAAIDLADNDILRFGSSDDWEFFHDGTNNLMDLNVGNLVIRDNVTTRLTIERTTGNIVSTGGASFLGNVGIGTASPATRLMVQDSDNIFVAHFSGLNQTNGVSFGTNSSNFALIQGYTRTFGGTNDITMQLSDNLLIGTTTSTGEKFQVNGTSKFSGSLTAGSDITLSAANPFVYGGTAAGSLGLSNIGGQSYIRVFGASHSTTPNVTQFVNAGSTSLTILGGGNVGIGTATINHILQVAPLATFGNAEDGNICISTIPSGGTSTSPTTTGGIIFGDNTVANAYLGRIAVIQDNPSASTASHMRFYTNSSGGNAATTEKLRITEAGNVLIGTQTDNGSRLRVNGSLALPHTTKSANYTLDNTDYTVGFDCASNRTATLPDATTCAGRIYVIYQYNTNLGARSVTLDGNGSQTINGLTTYNLLGYCDYSSVMIQSNGSNWIIIANALETCPV